MSITLASYDYGWAAGKLIHGAILAPPYNIQEAIQTWHGVTGAAIMYGAQTERVITLDVTFDNFTTEALLRAHVATVQSHIFDSGTLTVDSIAWPQSAFLGFTPSQAPFLDASGNHGYVQSGQLRFRQIRS
jgi:hypothetical protein